MKPARYQNSFKVELPPSGLSNGEVRKDFLDTIRNEITSVAYVAKEKYTTDDEVEFFIDYEMTDDIQDLYDLAVVVKDLERELNAVLYYGGPLCLEKPKFKEPLK